MFSDKDLESIKRTVEQMHDIVQRGKENDYSPQLLTLLEGRLDACRNQLSHLHEHLSNLSLELAPTHEKLISILRSVAAANTRRNVCPWGGPSPSSVHLTSFEVSNRRS